VGRSILSGKDLVDSLKSNMANLISSFFVICFNGVLVMFYHRLRPVSSSST
jgi:hypothetical protein